MNNRKSHGWHELACLGAAFTVTCLTHCTNAGTYVWQGGATTTGDWNVETNWEPAGIPGGGDTAKVNDAVTFTSDIEIASGKLCLVHTQGVTIRGVISGAGGFENNNGTSGKTLTLSGANTFTGSVRVNGNVALGSATAFGVQSSAIQHAKDLSAISFNCANATYAYDIAPTGVANYYYYFNAPGTLDGSIANDGISYFNAYIQVCKGNTNATCIITGRVGSRETTYPGLSMHVDKTSSLKILGGVKCNNISGNTTGDGWSLGWRYLGGECDIKKIKLAYLYGICCLSPTVLSKDTHLYFQTYSDGTKACVNLNGFSQTANRLTSSSISTTSAKFWRIYTPDNAPATLTLKPTEDALTNAAYLEGATSLVLDAPSASTVQIFQTRTSTTTGDLIVSNGVLRIADNASFPNVKRIVVAQGGTLEVNSATAFTPNGIDLSIETGATITLADNVSWTVNTFKIDGETLSPGSYTYAAGTIVVPIPVSDTATGVWTGGGDTTRGDDQKNWQGGYPGKIDLTFATGGTVAALTENLLAKSVTFTLPSASESFTITSNETALAKLYVAENVSMTAGDASQRATIDVPIVLQSATPTISVEDANNTLVLNGPLIQDASSLTLKKTGLGKLYLNATNSTIASGKVTFNTGTTYLKGGALGGTPNALTALTMQPTTKASTLYLNGGIFNQNITYVSTINGSDFYAAPGTTNIVNGLLTVRHNNANAFLCLSNSCTTLNGGYKASDSYQYRPTTHLYEGASLIFNGPYVVDKGISILAFITSQSVKWDPSRQNVVFGGKGSKAIKGLVLAGPMKVTFTQDFVFSHENDADLTPLYLLRINNETECVRPTIIDLNGHSQGFGSLVMRPKGKSQYEYILFGDSNHSYFTSDTPATLYIRQNGTPNTLGWVGSFKGAVSLVKCGTNTLTLANISTSTGRLEVAEGRLDFEDAGAWTNVSEVAVSGGELVLTDKNQVKKYADYHLTGGKLNLAESVHLVANSLYVADAQNGEVKMRAGVYTQKNLPTYISGEGSLRVRHVGFVFVIQ